MRSLWLWDFGTDLGVVCLPVAWLWYARQYAGEADWRTRGVTAFLVVAVGSVVLSAVSGDAGVLSALSVALSLITLVGVVGVLCYGLWLLFGLARRRDRVSRWQILGVTGLVTAPYLLRLAVGLWTLVRFAIDSVPVDRSLATAHVGELPVGFLVAGLLAAGVVRRYPVLGGFPRADAVARATVVRDLREPVVIVDYDGYVLDFNASAGDRFGVDQTVVGRELSAVEPALAELDLAAESTGTTWLDTADGRRQFQYSVSPVGAGSRTDAIAKALLLRDVTDRRVREQRLSVFNRVLRHNLRNDLDVLLAYANEIDDATVRDPIQRTAKQLESLGTKARRAERAMTAVSGAPSTVDPTDVVEGVAATYTDETESLSLSLPEQCPHTTYRSVVETVVDELLDNAVTHAPEPPSVAVTLTETATAVELTVADDGPGIPDHDRAVIEAGEESQHNHSTGMGLWLVRWAVTQLGGDVAFSDRDPTGTAVTIRLYD